MDENEIRKIVEKGLAQIAPEADFDDLLPTENLREELDIDSFDYLNFLIGLNETLGIDIPESDYEKLVSMNDLSGYLKRKLDYS